ncbi:hypothetical protein [Pseudorhodoferax sp. Leaf267]|nr:hypothetical protein [Pseudorhodoferax sp. Leaf267]
MHERLGLIEMLLFFGLVFGWAFWQWWGWRKWKKRQQQEEPPQ